jgi:hypothetical protein
MMELTIFDIVIPENNEENYHSRNSSNSFHKKVKTEIDQNLFICSFNPELNYKVSKYVKNIIRVKAEELSSEIFFKNIFLLKKEITKYMRIIFLYVVFKKTFCPLIKNCIT